MYLVAQSLLSPASTTIKKRTKKGPFPRHAETRAFLEHNFPGKVIMSTLQTPPMSPSQIQLFVVYLSIDGITRHGSTFETWAVCGPVCSTNLTSL